MLDNIKATTDKQKEILFNDVPNSIGRWLDAHPLINKIVVVVNHIFRAVAMYALMAILPFAMPINCLIGIAASIFYRFTIERFCHFRFAIPACAGGLAMQILNFGMYMESPVHTAIGMTSLALYFMNVVWISHKAVDALPKQSCCKAKA
jgi:hypothetical protein